MSRPGEIPMEPRDAARWHSRRRAWLRYGMALGHSEILELEHQITAGEAEQLWQGKFRPHRSAYRVRCRKRDMIVMYDTEIAAIVTVLPANAQWDATVRRPRRVNRRGKPDGQHHRDDDTDEDEAFPPQPGRAREALPAVR